MQGDVIVLGAGLGGSVLAAILARQGLDVVLVDRTPHPRFAIGESTIPYTTQALAALSTLYDVPELFPRTLRAAVGRRCGVKRHFAYSHHTPGQPADPERVHMVWLGEPEFHFFRQDVDQHLFGVAVQYGVRPLVGVDVDRVEPAEGRSTVHLADGRTVTGRLVVDATGYGSVIARQFGLRRADPGLRTHTRTLFTHLLGVRPYDEVVSVRRMPGALHAGTLHHVFDGGWMWVIPFDNHADSDNPLCSLGIQLDSRRHPVDPSVPPEEEAARWIARFPSVAAQLRDARAVRPWVRTGRLQYRSTAAAGPGWAMLPHAYGFVDPLYSRGLSCTLDGVKAVAERVLAAHADDDWSVGRFAELTPLYDRLVRAHDDLAFGSLVSWADPTLWSLWWFVWVQSTTTEFFVMLARHLHERQADSTLLRSIDHYPDRMIPGYDDYMRQAVAVMQGVDDGASTPREGAHALMALIRAQPFHYEPAMRYLLMRRHSRPPHRLWDLPALARFAWWTARQARPDIREMIMPLVKHDVFRYARNTV